jgi:FixJ family two-component response regulator
LLHFAFIKGGRRMIPKVIHIVDDDASFRGAIGELLEAYGYRVLLYESGTQLLKEPPDDEAACILLDVRMAGLNGPQLQRQLLERGCKLPIIFLSGHGDIPTTVETIKAGAEDFLTKPVTKEKLLEAIERALARYKAVQAQAGRISTLQSLFARLTPREREVFGLLVRGKPHKLIAHELGISERTVKLHRHQLVQKLQVHSLAELAILAERLRLLPGGDASGADSRTIEKAGQPVSNPGR